MTKELFVTSTPHETKVGLVEDDQLAEIYLERENEYTLAGSIYKGRVTRVLPGMQSAFVDVGLERDAFLYVSDFMELEDQDDDLTEVVSTKRVSVPESRPQPQPEIQLPPAAEGSSYVIESDPFAEEAGPEAPAVAAPEPSNVDTQPRDRGNDRGGFRGRRGRRRGRRGDQNDRYDRGDRGDRPSYESRFARPAASEAPATSAPARSRNSDYGPPPGYQPILLPGESISKYQRLAQQPQAPARSQQQGEAISAAPVVDAPAPIAKTFPEDEPFFAAGLTEPLHEQHGDEMAHQEWEREHALQERMNLAAAFAREVAPAESVETEEETHSAPPEPQARSFAGASASAETTAPVEPPSAYGAHAGTVQEEEIEEEEADLTSAYSE